jgi:hypothetical protein
MSANVDMMDDVSLHKLHPGFMVDFGLANGLRVKSVTRYRLIRTTTTRVDGTHSKYIFAAGFQTTDCSNQMTD